MFIGRIFSFEKAVHAIFSLFICLKFNVVPLKLRKFQKQSGFSEFLKNSRGYARTIIMRHIFCSLVSSIISDLHARLHSMAYPPTNITSTTIEADTEEFLDDVNNEYPVNIVYSNNGDIDIDDEESVLEDSANESVRSEHYSVF